MVILVWHSLLLSSVRLDVDNVSDLEDAEVGRHPDHATLFEPALEHVAGAATVTEGVRHFE